MKSSINKKYDVNELFFENVDTKEKAYFLGLMMSDGTVSERSIIISLQERDKNILEKFKKTIQHTGPLSLQVSKNINHQSSSILRIYSRELVKSLTILGCGKRKTYTLRFPNIKEEFYSHFIRGFFDGDGCIIKTKSGYYFSITGNKNFLLDLNNILSKCININPCKISRKNKSSELFGAIQYSKNSDLLKIRDYIYKDCKDIYIERKYIKFFQIEEKVTKLCKICNKPHEAKGFCKTCYHREIFYKPLKKERIISCKNINTKEIKTFKNIKEAVLYTEVKYNAIWKNLNNKSTRAGNFKFSY